MKPIIFNPEMVKAILEGRKTVTRRVMKPQPENTPHKIPQMNLWAAQDGNSYNEMEYRPPYCPGDILWVRESWAEMPYGYVYRADGDDPEGWDPDDHWYPSTNMPRKATRIFLRVTDVHPERLQEITAVFEEVTPAVRQTIANLWNISIKPADLPAYGWEANPWVWVIQFERISKEEAFK